MNESRLTLSGVANLADRFFLLFLLAAYALAAVFPDPGLRIGQTPTGEFSLLGDRVRLSLPMLLLAVLLWNAGLSVPGNITPARELLKQAPSASAGWRPAPALALGACGSLVPAPPQGICDLISCRGNRRAKRTHLERPNRQVKWTHPSRIRSTTSFDIEDSENGGKDAYGGPIRQHPSRSSRRHEHS